VENTVNERLKILMGALNLTPAAFAKVLGVSGSTVRNYFDSERNTKPGYEVLEKLYHSFGHINLPWLFGAPGAPLVDNKSEASTIQTGSFNQTGNNIQKVKGNKNNVQTNNGDHATITNNVKLDDCQRELKVASEKIELLTSQLADKERTIQILLKQIR
jgi:transcriptional regulator with XRE-family HTH domain